MTINFIINHYESSEITIKSEANLPELPQLPGPQADLLQLKARSCQLLHGAIQPRVCWRSGTDHTNHGMWNCETIINPIGSMYGIYANIWGISVPKKRCKWPIWPGYWSKLITGWWFFATPLKNIRVKVNWDDDRIETQYFWENKIDGNQPPPTRYQWIGGKTYWLKPDISNWTAIPPYGFRCSDFPGHWNYHTINNNINQHQSTR